MLTAAEVEQKTFSTALRGYDLDEVDDFLDEIVATIRELTDQLEAAQQGRPAAAAPVTAPAPEPAPEPVAEAEQPATTTPPAAIDESAIGRALLAAQTAADQLLADAQSRAEQIVSEARGEADTLEAEKEAKRAETEAEIAALAARVNSIRSELSVLAGEVSDKLDQMDAVVNDGHGADEGGEVVAIADHMTDEPLDLGDDEDDEGVEDEAGSEDGGEADKGDGETEEARDHLDEILTGVANDLQFGSRDGGQDGDGGDGGDGDDGDDSDDEDD